MLPSASVGSSPIIHAPAIPTLSPSSEQTSFSTPRPQMLSATQTASVIVATTRCCGKPGSVSCFTSSKLADSDLAKLQPDHEHGKPAQYWGDDDAQPAQPERNRDLHQPREQRHPEHELHAAALGSHHRGGEIGGGEHRGRKEAGPYRSARQCLQPGADGEGKAGDPSGSPGAHLPHGRGG